jgi:hypothetical protein
MNFILTPFFQEKEACSKRWQEVKAAEGVEEAQAQGDVNFGCGYVCQGARWEQEFVCLLLQATVGFLFQYLLLILFQSARMQAVGTDLGQTGREVQEPRERCYCKNRCYRQ